MRKAVEITRGPVRGKAARKITPDNTLDRERFLRITRRDDLDKVLEGLEVARRIGFGPIKINAVAVKNLVEPDIVPLARFGREHYGLGPDQAGV